MDTTIIKHKPQTEITASPSISHDRHGAVLEDINLETGQSINYRRALFVLSCLATLMTVRYLVWRLSVNQWNLWWLSLPLLVAELFTAAHVLGYQYTVLPRKPLSFMLLVDVQYLPVYVFIPTVNEGSAILGPTIEGAIAARDKFLSRHPKAKVTIVVCNDGRVANVPGWQAAESLAQKYGVECITRTEPGGAKAGNIENARRHFGATGKCLIAVLDADQIAEPDFFLRSVALFGDRTIGWVQTRQYYRNSGNAVSRWAEHQASLFYDLVCPGKSMTNSSYICGTNVIIRAQVLDEIGGFPTDSVTEDFAASIRTHNDWRSVYLKDILARGLGPLDLTGYFVQQSRWARGTIGVLRSDWKRLLLPDPQGLTSEQRIQYLLSGTHYFCGIRDLVFLATALASLYLSDSPIKAVSIQTIALFLLPYMAASQLVLFFQTRSIVNLTGSMIGYISFPTLVVSTFEAVFNKRMKFLVTPKSETGASDLRAILPHIFLIIICIAVIAHAFATGKALTRVDLVPLVWVAYAVIMLSPVFFLAKFRARR